MALRDMIFVIGSAVSFQLQECISVGMSRVIDEFRYRYVTSLKTRENTVRL